MKLLNFKQTRVSSGWWQVWKWGVPVVFAVSLLGMTDVAVAETPSSEDVFDHLKASDARYTENVTIRGTSAIPPRETRERLYVRDWVYSSDGSESAVVETTIDFAEYSPSTERPVPLVQSVADKRGWEEDTGVYVETFTHIDAGRGGRKAVKAITPEGVSRMEDLDGKPLAGAVVIDPSPDAMMYPVMRILWTMGRDYARYLDEIVEVSEGPEGLIEVSAQGRNGAGQPGRWELAVEPASDWMVRGASFVHDPQPELGETLRITNTGSQTKNGMVIPEHGAFYHQIWGAPVDMLFEDIIAAPNSELIQRAHRGVFGPSDEKSTAVIDFSVEPPVFKSTVPFQESRNRAR